MERGRASLRGSTPTLVCSAILAACRSSNSPRSSTGSPCPMPRRQPWPADRVPALRPHALSLVPPAAPTPHRPLARAPRSGGCLPSLATSGTTITLVKRVSLLLALLAVGCGASSSNSTGGSTTAKPLLTGDTCGVYTDSQSCVTTGCAFAVNTRPCVVGQPCPAGWCYAPGPSQPPVGPVAECACEGITGDVCVLQLGGPAVHVGSPPGLSCRRGCQFFAPATPDDICTCVAQGAVERCWPSAMVQNLCDCDNGVR
jgi:hypothetical protein